MKIKKRILRYLGLALIVLLVSQQLVIAQQKEIYTQYMFNAVAINPAFSGVHETVSATLHIRDQWGGLEGAPTTQTFSIHGPNLNDKSAFGLNVMRDVIGISNYSKIDLNYAYRISFNKEAMLSFGLNVGLNQFKDDISRVDFNNLSGVTFVPVHETFTNFGFGALWYSPNYYLGLSVPSILNNSISMGDNQELNMIRHYLLCGGVVFELNENLKLKPNFLMKSVSGAPISFDLNSTLLIQDVIWVGLSWRAMTSWSALMEINITPQLTIGYAYDLTRTELSRVENGSHEFMMNYRLMYKDDVRTMSPRNF